MKASTMHDLPVGYQTYCGSLKIPVIDWTVIHHVTFLLSTSQKMSVELNRLSCIYLPLSLTG
eukprot:10088786-Prorocentrum_lima.AAC.1